MPDEIGAAMTTKASRYGFTDPITKRVCQLVVPSDGSFFPTETEQKIGIIHPDCDHVADLSVQLDAFYCPACGWNGRVSGAWVVRIVSIGQPSGT